MTPAEPGSHPTLHASLAKRVGAGLALGLLFLLAELVGARPAHAHGVGGRSDLPLPLWKVAWAAAAAVLVSFAALGVLWTRPRLSEARGVEITGGAAKALRVLGVIGMAIGAVLFVVVISAGIIGSTNPSANPLPTTIYIVVWVGVMLVCALVGDIWGPMSPAVTFGGRQSMRPAALDANPTSGNSAFVDAGPIGSPVSVTPASGTVPDTGTGPLGTTPKRTRPPVPTWLEGNLPAAALLFGFLWLELAYFDSGSPRVLGWAGLVVTLVLAAGGLRWGRRWSLDAAGFTALFGLIGAMAPIGRDEPDGPLRLRLPLSGLSRVTPKRGTAAMLLIVLGGTTFDGLARTDLWRELVDQQVEWGWTAFQTFGLIWTIMVMAMAYSLAVFAMSRITGEEASKLSAAFLPSLVPIVVAYAVAHYFSLLVLEGQLFWITLSDPWGQGWDLLGTADGRIDYGVLAPSTISWVQAGAIVVGHVAAVLAAHDRSLELFEEELAVRSQLPMLAVMVAYTVAGLLILFSG